MGYSAFGGDAWPADARLDPYRESVWLLERDGEVAGHLISTVARMRSFPLFWIKQEWMWFGIAWADGEYEGHLEDYGPAWYNVSELEQGFYEDADRGRFDARPLTGLDRDALWEQYGDRL